ncbi:MAG: hypothetical protein NZ483_04390 [Verrucomicrobiae bacterium]|nr:hypothetical protein [Verrucomicrobiae bacterium]MDW8343077.1 hypothetical protein [Verrucomicrobiae bacterium]
MGWRRSEKPVDRLLRDVDRELTQVRRRVRVAERTQPMSEPVGGHGKRSDMREFVGEMLATPKQVIAPTYRVHVPPVVDVAPNLARDWEATEQPVGAVSTAAVAGAAGQSGERVDAKTDKLVRYLSVGSLRRYPNEPPTEGARKALQRTVWLWVGLGGVVVGVLYLWLR